MNDKQVNKTVSLPIEITYYWKAYKLDRLQCERDCDTNDGYYRRMSNGRMDWWEYWHNHSRSWLVMPGHAITKNMITVSAEYIQLRLSFE